MKKRLGKQKKKHTFPLAGSRESTGGATALLEVEATAATPNTEGVGLVPPLTKTPCSLPLPLLQKHASM